MQLYACLPFVELVRPEGIALGPIHFWPSSQYLNALDPKLHQAFIEYLDTVGQIKAFSEQSPNKFITTLKLAPNLVTCITLDEKVEDKQALLVDALYLFYFAATFRNVYYDQEIPSISSFTKVIPAEEAFILNPDNWKDTYISEAKRESTACINWIDEELCQYLGKVLSLSYLEKNEEGTRVLTAIRYFIDRFFNKFKNPISKGMHFNSNLFDAEDIIFMGSSFDALLDISQNHSASDFRQKIRPMLHLKFSRPLEIFWDWVDGFYQLKHQIVHGNANRLDTFNKNPNYNIDFMQVGIKLFIYIAYYKLCAMNGKLEPSAFAPPEFKNLHPDELLKYFWSEDAILRKLSLLMMQTNGEVDKAENEFDIQQLTRLYVKFFEKNSSEFVHQNKGAYEVYAQAILEHEKKYQHLFADRFIARLKERIAV